MVQYDDFAETFGRSRDGLHWAEIDRLLLHFVGSYTNPQWDIADIGCGNGRLLEHIVSSDIVTDFRDHKTRYIGVDLSQKLLSQAREKTINQLGISTEWILGDMTDIGTVLS